VLFSCMPDVALAEETKMLRLPASSNPEILMAQKTMLEAWQIVGESFVDGTFNKLDWMEELRSHMLAAYSDEDSPKEAWGEINSMLAVLNDPYTRRIPVDEYEKFRSSAEGELKGVGLIINNQPNEGGHLSVIAPIKGSPADRAGILPGDMIMSINGQDATGWGGQQAASILHGQGGSLVRLSISRRTPPSNGTTTDGVVTKELMMQRASVSLSPVFATLLPDLWAKGGAGPPPTVGYVRLSQFSANAAAKMRDAVVQLKAGGASSYILDLRNNPGGLVQAGVDVSAIFLDGSKTVFTVASRGEGQSIQTTENFSPALTHDPMIVLVDKGSASASEIVSGALRDNGRALLMGDHSTYGKGRIQSLYELQDGSALFVTVAKYLTPGGSDIDKVGITPDLSCSVGASTAASPKLRPTSTLSLPSGDVLVPKLQANGSAGPVSGATALLSKSHAEASQVAPVKDETFTPGVPLESGGEALLRDSIKTDRCVLAAEKYLASTRGAGSSAPAKVFLAQDESGTATF